ncbi:maleylpyruvate isomerase family mycothiol-dependent enzyme [Streptantibioticus cattleyicolor]|uniref:Mycothiol-dependent maleylpyruvate isomerase metal-binding domain-containing protein n=1 Tax=Streptantibioticus cattleyicolor (strain ATCC 35852 / DSM 46488 / JCM 4925 / NBRC 14057 / NRRL 8057) TaxID=1003195 RepID=F8JNB9_STREN|nr:maleylpyruvate isomerase family mycothiol-dependent enzyme [Streptantibioticus cattleyicolor]AEW99121.1 hypothetical protein SCATT_p09280 [Streptantibioticus cattleyicolor NRRL 8057 = DSM 46488]CCB71836.1 conserved protein of unknown function [Streptantibioticus cattleyicolor NRRL 8057 = DSM 46488]
MAHTTDHVKALIAAERRELAAVLHALRPEQWEAPSLCTGWRVREVAAHMSTGFRHPTRKVLWELVKSAGRVNAMADRLARADATALTPGELADAMADNAHHPWKPPVGGYENALGHDVVHGLDITTALGLDRRIPEERLRVLLAGVTRTSARFFGAPLHGIRLQADDLDWTFGTGTPVTGNAQDLLLAAFGRKLPPGRLSGPGGGRFVRVPGVG